MDETDREKVQPLPNLDYKVMQGNSLIELLSPEFLAVSQDRERNEMVKKLEQLKKDFFNAYSSTKKDRLRDEIDKLIRSLIEHDRQKGIESLRNQIKAIQDQPLLIDDKHLEKAREAKVKELRRKIEELRSIGEPGPTEHFEWRINFSEVFQEKG